MTTQQLEDTMEQHGPMQLIVADGWAHVVWRRTGHEIGGPVSTRLDVKRMLVLGRELLPMLAGPN